MTDCNVPASDAPREESALPHLLAIAGIFACYVVPKEAKWRTETAPDGCALVIANHGGVDFAHRVAPADEIAGWLERGEGPKLGEAAAAAGRAIASMVAASPCPVRWPSVPCDDGVAIVREDAASRTLHRADGSMLDRNKVRFDERSRVIAAEALTIGPVRSVAYRNSPFVQALPTDPDAFGPPKG